MALYYLKYLQLDSQLRNCTTMYKTGHLHHEQN